MEAKSKPAIVVLLEKVRMEVIFIFHPFECFVLDVEDFEYIAKRIPLIALK